MRQLSLLQSAVDSYYKLREVLQSAIDLLQIATNIIKCNYYYKLRQYKVPSTMSGTVSCQELLPKFFLNGTFDIAENNSRWKYTTVDYPQ